MHEEGLIDPYFSLTLAHTPQNASVTLAVETTDNIPL
ncbi:hypothetical protein N7462_009165 [Penicillium macrosclerotiorum]|nr:uncharacterized protein N7462_009165 [Penicillium macrosclerotiorum]KAJ5676268.1 hypothetical protein N7462_009165 [Penicillium macrosclerotiorum]